MILWRDHIHASPAANARRTASESLPFELAAACDDADADDEDGGDDDALSLFVVVVDDDDGTRLA